MTDLIAEMDIDRVVAYYRNLIEMSTKYPVFFNSEANKKLADELVHCRQRIEEYFK